MSHLVHAQVFSKRAKWAAFALDLVLALLAAVWLARGLEWQGYPLLRHGADLRRTALLLAGGAAWAMPELWDISYWLRGARGAWALLQRPHAPWIALGLGFLFASALGVLQALALRVPLYDVGIFHQILWGVAHGHGFVSTVAVPGISSRIICLPRSRCLPPSIGWAEVRR